MSQFAKPESVLKRADELINVGQKQAALQALHALITSKKYRAWQKTLEKIMFKYVELCVDMRRGRFAKDGLIQYRIVCQQVNVGSLEDVIKYFMQLAMERAEQARSEAQVIEDALDVEDLEADKRPEDLMLSYVSGEKGKDRCDREVVTPWFKFLWETYRTVLEILRNNSKLEALYAMTTHRAFQFCKEFKRTTEFRRLCEIIRNHLANLNKYRDQRDRPDLTAPESLQLYLDTRVEQLKIATDLALWQEAFRSVEDIHGLMMMVKKCPKPSLMVVYYAKLTEIFWMADSHLYHAYAWLKLFTLQKSYNKNLTQKDLQLIASSVLLAALSVTPYENKYGSSRLELENEKDRNLRMSNLIGFNLDPKNREPLSRSSLLLELASKGVMTCVSQEMKDLYNFLENEFLPLDLASKVQPLLAKISKLGGKLSSASSVPEVQLSKYIPALENLTTLRVLQQVSQVYQSMKIDMFSEMNPFFDFSIVEKISVDAVKYNFLAVKVDYRKRVMIFGNEDIESDKICDHLTVLADSFDKAWKLIYSPLKKQLKQGDNLQNLAEVVGLVAKEHKRLLARKSIIEKRKEDHERQIQQMEREEDLKKVKLQKIAEHAENERLATEYARRKEQMRREIEEKELKEAQELLRLQDKLSKKKGKIIMPEGDVTKEKISELNKIIQVKERQEKEKKLQKLAKIMDHLERAKREEEAPLIEQEFEQRLVEEKILHEREQHKEIELSRQHHDGDLQEKKRLSRMLDNKVIFQERIVSRREAEYNHLKKEREARINQVSASRKHEKEIKRKLLFFLKSEQERLTKLHEEEEARKIEEAEKKRKEEAERIARLNEIAEKQRQREMELEERERQRRGALLGRTSDLTNSAGPVASRPSESLPPTAATEPSSGKYVPKFRREVGAPNSEPERADRWGHSDDRPPQSTDRCGRSDDQRTDDRRPPLGGGSRLPSSSTSWSSSRCR